MAIENLPKLEFGGVALVPERDSYRVENPFGVRISNIEGGFSRSASDHMGGPAIVRARYFLNADEYQYFQDFYYGVILEGALSFAADLVIANNALETHACKIVGPVNFPTITGFNAEVNLMLEVDPAVNFDVASSRGVLTAIYGNNLGNFLNRIAQFATVETTNSISSSRFP